MREPSSVVVLRDEFDFVGEVFDAAFGDARVEQQRAAELQLVAAGELVLFDWLAVDERAVRAAEVADENCSPRRLNSACSREISVSCSWTAFDVPRPSVTVVPSSRKRVP